MPSPSNQPRYGTKHWFDQMFESQSDGCDRWGHQWRASQRFRHRLTLNLIKNFIRQPNDQKILDIGCGLGDFIAEVQQLNPDISVHGMDISDVAIKEAARKYPHIQFTVGRFPEFACSCKLNGIISLDCIFYLSEEDRQKSFQNVYKCLTTGGWFVFSSPVDDGLRYFKPDKAIEQIKYTGLSIHNVFYNYGQLYKCIEKPLLTIYDLPFTLSRLNLKDSKQLKSIYKLINFVFKLSILRSTIIAISGAASSTSKTILQQMPTVVFFDRISRKYLKEKGWSHIIIIATKT